MESSNNTQSTTSLNSGKGAGEKELSKNSSVNSIQSDTHYDSSKEEGSSQKSNRSQDDNGQRNSSTQLPTFTNEVVVIRPEIFYENEDCHKDNKFMKHSGLKR
jgi:hypothetical protein